MAGRLIKDLETAINIDEEDFMIIEQYDGTKKIKVRALKDFISNLVISLQEK